MNPDTAAIAEDNDNDDDINNIDDDDAMTPDADLRTALRREQRRSAQLRAKMREQEAAAARRERRHSDAARHVFAFAFPDGWAGFSFSS